MFNEVDMAVYTKNHVNKGGSSQLIEHTKCYCCQTSDLVHTLLKLMPTYNSLKTCKGTMFFLCLPLGKTLEQVKHSSNSMPLYMMLSSTCCKTLYYCVLDSYMLVLRKHIHCCILVKNLVLVLQSVLTWHTSESGTESSQQRLVREQAQPWTSVSTHYEFMTVYCTASLTHNFHEFLVRCARPGFGQCQASSVALWASKMSSSSGQVLVSLLNWTAVHVCLVQSVLLYIKIECGKM